MEVLPALLPPQEQIHTSRNPNHRFLNIRFGSQKSIMAHSFFLHFYCTNTMKTETEIIPPSFPSTSAVSIFLHPPQASFSSLAFPSRGLISPSLLGLGDQANSAVFPALLQGREWEACLGRSIWTEQALWSVATGSFLLAEQRAWPLGGRWHPALSLPGICPVTLSKGLHSS